MADQDLGNDGDAAGREATPASRPAHDRLSTALVATRNGWNAFAEWTIRAGAEADIPRRVKALELDKKARATARTIATGSRIAATRSAEGFNALETRTRPILRKAGEKMVQGSAAATAGLARMGRGTVATSRTLAARGVDSVRAEFSRRRRRTDAPDTAATTTAETMGGLDRLLAEDMAGNKDARGASMPASGDLPLFTAAPVPSPPPPQPTSTVAPQSPAPSPTAPPALPSRSDAAAAPPAAPASTQQRLAADDPVRRPSAPLSSSAMPTDPAPGQSGAPPSDPPPARAERTLPATRLILAGVAALGLTAAATLWYGADPGPDTARQMDAPAESPIDGDGGIDPASVANRAEIESVVRAYILAHPEIIPEAMERLQRRETAAALDGMRERIEAPFAGAWAGNPDGDVVITQFSDYACGYCRQSLADVERLLRTDRNVKVVYRELAILSPDSAHAAKVALAAARRGRYHDFHVNMYALRTPTPAHVAQAAARVGIDAATIKAAASDDAFASELEANRQIATQLRFTGTPTFVIGDQILHGAVGYDALVRAVGDARSTRSDALR